MSEQDESGLLHEHFSRFGISADEMCNTVISSDTGYGKILPKDSHGRSLSSNSVIFSYPSLEVSYNSASRSLPGSNLTSPSRGNVGKACRPVGAIESFVVEGSNPSHSMKNSVPSNYKLYERGHIIAANKFATPRPVETVIPRQNEAEPQRQNGDRYYIQPSYSKHSPTHSLSGSSKDSNSPRTSVAASQYNTSLYENVDYYSRGQVYQLPSSHSSISSQDSKHSSPRTSVANAEGHFESSYKRAQPQVPAGVKFKEYPPYEAPPVYENIQDLHLNNHTPVPSYSSQINKPGPQVAAIDKQKYSMLPISPTKGNPPPPYSSNQPYIPVNKNIPLNHSATDNDLMTNNLMSQGKMLHNTYQASYPSQYNCQGYGVQKQPNYQLNPDNFQPDEVNFDNAEKPLHSENNKPQTNYLQYSVKAPHSSAPAVPVYPSSQIQYNQTMASHSGPSQCLPLDSPGIFAQGGASGILTDEENCMAAKAKPFPGNVYSGKNLLPYNVTPPRHTGPTEAERKIEELTRQLEEEMEKQEEEGEYFGKQIIIVTYIG